MKFSSVILSVSIAAAATAASAGTPDQSACNVWIPACHYTVSSRPSSYAISYVVIHKTQGATAAGAANWFANCASGGSAHYTYDKANGYCYQSVREKDVSWNAGYSSTNNRSIGIEHSGFITSNDTSKACYDASGWETRSCCIYYGTPFSRANIIGHNQVPGCPNPGGGGTSCHTDPGVYWDWTYYMSASHPSVGGAIRQKWLDIGGSRHPLGNPTTGELGCPDGVGRYNHFQGGSIYWTASIGAKEVHGSIRTKWSQTGWENGPCGYPITDESTCPDGQGKYNHFSKGASIYWHPSIGTAYEVHGSIRAKWSQTGWETGPLGYPITDESTCPDGQGKYNHFSKGGSVYWHPSTGAFEVHGKIREHWASLGWERSSLGYPASDEYVVAGTNDRRNNFQRGTITWHAATNTCTVP